MLHEIKIDKTYHDGNLEKDISKKLLREKFFTELKYSKIKMSYLLQNYKSDLNNLAEFNYFLKIVKQTLGLTIIQSLIYLQEEEYPIKTLYNLLSSENRHTFELECSDKKIGYFRKNKKSADTTSFEKFFIC